ncbi:hypothetical protein PtA15_2A293 [Puccinia triticina]|uniref:Uncharacterized protein n=1 Tax=Puccinia triticina TaxID=208348 RepID=A0ABY7CDP8_9BASI|nr:uncharacterized protein PtA15_2A293 [Puccinia triticina]WAQ81980.1 hypothetical protein PtA15_2A293 [Puccinia triticina]WAR52861.1 hypothetical protein PtB15_2B289 [Puccinia triticina]
MDASQHNHSSHTTNAVYGDASGEAWQEFMGIDSNFPCEQPLMPIAKRLTPIQKAHDHHQESQH